MFITCPHCKRRHDVSFDTVFAWIKNNEKLRKAVSSQIGRINAAKVKNRAPVVRDSAWGKKLAAARYGKK